ncbi:acetylxylan esterase [Actomonas aquatica]|uniref:Acetylxylan esterase n=1 Tax=Actomonas aquatica TaxID=2866162 RepID=A0ABZ1C842_9BACT|nr:acetylxylan esterase [Opitutus sp. WL0086]WRQ87867.1 acetylxylan esterase [Opitutus sp. WL0086]
MQRLALAFLLLAAALRAAPELSLTLDHADWVYGLDDTATFTVRVLDDGQPVPDATVTYQLGPERFETDYAAVTVPAAGLVLTGSMTSPGFLRCKVSYGEQSALATAAFAPEQLTVTQTDPADFDAFWASYIERLAAIPMNLSRELDVEASTEEVLVYKVSFDAWNFSDRPMRFYGMLTMPAAPGRYPAVLRVPGAGVRPYTGEKSLAARGMIVLQIGIHGIPVDLPEPLYQNLRAGALNYYPEFNLDNRDRYYFLRVYLACLRANDVLTQEENWDNTRLVVAGGSQGGQLSIVTSALDPRVTGTVTNYPAYCDTTGYLTGRAGGWPHLLSKPENQTAAKLETTRYYDTANFARRLHAPISLAFGYNDETCPPTSMQAVYNLIAVEKTLMIEKEMGHRSSRPFAKHYADRVAAMAGVQ